MRSDGGVVARQAVDEGAGWRRELPRRLRKARVVLLYPLVALSIAVGAGLLTALLAFDRRDGVRRARRFQWLTARSFRTLFRFLRVAGIARLESWPPPEALPSSPCVVVANHSTLLDVGAIMIALGGGCAVVKPAVFRRRWLRALMQAFWHIQGTAGDRLATRRVMDAAVDRLRHGLPVIIFPEGTRAPGSGRLPFGRTAFEIACRARVPVVSLLVRCEPPWLSKQAGLYQPPHPMPHLRLEVLATDDPAAVDFDSRSLKRRVEGRYPRCLPAKEVPGGLPRRPSLPAKEVP
jgi:1-acyl-sn-glycerol-3-phosphate acyltransferase